MYCVFISVAVSTPEPVFVLTTVGVLVHLCLQSSDRDREPRRYLIESFIERYPGGKRKKAKGLFGILRGHQKNSSKSALGLYCSTCGCVPLTLSLQGEARQGEAGEIAFRAFDCHHYHHQQLEFRGICGLGIKEASVLIEWVRRFFFFVWL